MKFGETYLTQFCPNGHPLLVMTGKCKFNCGNKAVKIKREKELHGKSKSPNRFYDYQ